MRACLRSYVCLFVLLTKCHLPVPWIYITETIIMFLLCHASSEPHDHSVISFIHPMFGPFGCIGVGVDYVKTTMGSQMSTSCVPRFLCMLYQQARCYSGHRCNQIHVDRAYMEGMEAALRDRQPMCCWVHGDKRPTSKVGHQVQLRWGPGVFFCLPGAYFPRTAFWFKYDTRGCESRPVVVSRRDVCLLYQNGKCNYGVTCRHVHICRSIWRCLIVYHSSSYGDCTVDDDDILKDLDEILDCLRTETAEDIAITSSVSKVKQSAQ